MTFPTDLLQRFVDGDLSAAERIAFVGRLGRDGALREQAIALEQLGLTASRLPKPIVPADFVANVMARTAVGAPWWQRAADALRTPRLLQWNMASVLTAAAVVVLAGLGVVVWRGPAASRSTSTTALSPPAATSSRETGDAPVLVRLVVLQAGVHTVQVAGDFNDWNPSRTSLDQISNGAWSVTLPLRPGRYKYMLVLDGQRWIADPFAAERTDDGFGSQNAVLEVRRPSNATEPSL